MKREIEYEDDPDYEPPWHGGYEKTKFRWDGKRLIAQRVKRSTEDVPAIRIEPKQHKHRWVPVEFEHYRCECGQEIFGMFVQYALTSGV